MDFTCVVLLFLTYPLRKYGKSDGLQENDSEPTTTQTAEEVMMCIWTIATNKETVLNPELNCVFTDVFHKSKKFMEKLINECITLPAALNFEDFQEIMKDLDIEALQNIENYLLQSDD